MKLPNWIRRPDATVEELREQLAAATNAHNHADAAVQAAEEAFDRDPSAEKALLAARDAARVSNEHVRRAQRLLAAAVEREQEAERQRKQARLAALDRELANDALQRRRAPTLEKEVEALRDAAAAHHGRRMVEREIARLEIERRTLRAELTGDQSAPITDVRTEPYAHVVSEALHAAARGVEDDAARNDLGRLARNYPWS